MAQAFYSQQDVAGPDVREDSDAEYKICAWGEGGVNLPQKAGKTNARPVKPRLPERQSPRQATNGMSRRRMAWRTPTAQIRGSRAEVTKTYVGEGSAPGALDMKQIHCSGLPPSLH